MVAVALRRFLQNLLRPQPFLMSSSYICRTRTCREGQGLNGHVHVLSHVTWLDDYITALGSPLVSTLVAAVADLLTGVLSILGFSCAGGHLVKVGFVFHAQQHRVE